MFINGGHTKPMGSEPADIYLSEKIWTPILALPFLHFKASALGLHD